jgi:uncharacterized membrane protein YhhN
MIFGLLISAIVSSLLAIYTHTASKVKLFSVFKPLTTIFIIALSAIIYFESQSFYSLIVLISLFFCLIGDIFLIEYKHLVAGIASFLIAHIGFIIAFISLYGFSYQITPVLILGIVSALFYLYLFNSLSKYTVSVAVYFLVIVVMNWQGIGLLYKDISCRNLLIALGSVLFLISDSVIAINKFKVEFKASEPIILSTYWLAICLLVFAGRL